MVLLTDDQQRVILAGIGWLYDTDQPHQALVTQHGIKSLPTDQRRYSFTPAGTGSRHLPVIVVHVAHSRYTSAGELTNPLEPRELEGLADELERMGYKVADLWNGEGETGSLALANEAHPTLVAAQRRYHNGCPEHSSTLCGWRGCPWYRNGAAALQRPEQFLSS